jgi:hypothetical protein
MPLDKFQRREVPTHHRTGFTAGPSTASPTFRVTEAGDVAISGSQTIAGSQTVTGTVTQTGVQTFAAPPVLALGAFSTAQSLTPDDADCDGTKEYILAATQIHRFTKIDDTIGWMGQGFTAIGAVAAAIVPD